MQVGTSVLVIGSAYDQLIIHYQRGHVFHYIFYNLGAEDRNSISRKFFIGFCIQDQPFSSYAWSGVPEPVSHSLYSFIHISHILLSLK